MNHELKRIDPLRAANVSAVVYGLVVAAFVLIALPFFVVIALFLPDDASPGGAIVMLLLLIFYPLLGVILGWLSGLLTSAAYNLVVRWTGGLLFDLGPTSSPGGGGA